MSETRRMDEIQRSEIQDKLRAAEGTHLDPHDGNWDSDCPVCKAELWLETCSVGIVKFYEAELSKRETSVSVPGAPAGEELMTISADDFEHLALMGVTADRRIRLGEGAAERVMDHARRLVSAQGDIAPQAGGVYGK